MRIKKKQSLSKIPEKLSATTMEPFFPREERKLAPLEDKRERPLLPKDNARLPPLRRNLRNASTRIIEPPEPRKETETTLSESSMMFQSMYGKEWLKPSDYAKEIGTLNLLGEGKEVETL
jgi:hypothetical protein